MFTKRVGENYFKNKRKVNELFKLFRKEGFVARQNFLCCSTCALAQLEDEGKASKYVYYHSQDGDRFKEEGNRVALRYDSEYGEDLATIAMEAGFIVNWNGDALRIIELYMI